MAGFHEWEIKNFSCWNGDIHQEFYTAFDEDIQLYPRGSGGIEDYIEVRIDPYYLPSDDEELSFICSDGSVICTREPNADAKSHLRVFTGPKFEEVSAGIRRNEPMHKDRLILRWKTPKGCPSCRIQSVIQASSAFFQINPEMLYLNDWKPISVITLRCMDGNEKHICLYARKTGSKIEDANVGFKLDCYIKENVLVRTSIWLLKGDKIMRKYENYLTIVKDRDHYFFENPLKEFQGMKNIIRCKIITDPSSRILQYTTHLPLSSSVKMKDFSKLREKEFLESLKTVIPDETRESASLPQPESSVAVLAKDFMCLYQDNVFSDCELRCDAVSFRAHRAVLSARSPVFKAMLSGDMKEAACGRIDVEDLDPHTLGRFLAFLYGGDTGEEALGWAEASRLYYAADKYQMPSLKKECSVVLRDSVAIENVCDILSLADKHQDEELRSVAHEFILENYNGVLGSENWEKLLMSDPVLVAKTLTNFVKINGVMNVIRK